MLLNWRETLKYRMFAAFVSGALLLLCGAGVLYRGGLLYGIDFTGGLRVLLEFKEDISTDRMSSIRELFNERLDEAQLNTVSLHGEEERRGLYVTVRGHELVSSLTNRLYEYGRAGGSSDFSDFRMTGPASVLGRDILRENFAVGSPTSENSNKIDLSRAPRERINSRVQSIVNSRLSQQIVTMLRERLTDSSQWRIDLNWADADQIQQWLVKNQLEAFIEGFRSIRSEERLDRWEQINSLLKEFNIPRDQFKKIFALTDQSEDRLNLNTIDTQGFREIMLDEFFQGRYSELSRRIVDVRGDRGLFRSMNEFLGLSFIDQLHKQSIREEAGLSPFVKVRSEMISPSIGADYIGLAAMAILISLVGILIYLSIRFQFKYSIGAIVAIIHDIFVTVGLLTVIGIRFDISVVAAVLTVIGYSLNDTIVNFDRVRENKVLMGHGSNWYDVINRSVFEVLNRTVVTSISTLMAAVVLFFGGVALKAFAITLIIGVIAGTYSSIFVSNPTLYFLQRSN